MSVTIDLIRGEARLAGVRLDGIEDASDIVPGAIRAGNGTVLKPLSYGLRTTLCSRHRTPSALAAAVLAAAADGPADDLAMQALALHLAGADVDRTLPGFSDVALVMGQLFGWAPEQLAESPAQWVDALASSALDPGSEEIQDGWKSFRISAGREPGQDGIGALRDQLAEDLIRRSTLRLTAQPGRAPGGAVHPGPSGPSGSAPYSESSDSVERTNRPLPLAPDRVATMAGDEGSRRNRTLPYAPDAPVSSVNRPLDPATAGEPQEARLARHPAPPRRSPAAHAADRVPMPTDGSSASAAATPASRSRPDSSPLAQRSTLPDTRVSDTRSVLASAASSAMTVVTPVVSPLESRPLLPGPAPAHSRSHGRDTGAQPSAGQPATERRRTVTSPATSDASIADRVARALHDECDIRGILRW